MKNKEQNGIIKFRAWDIKNKYMFGAGYNDWKVSKIETHDYLKMTLDGIVVRQMLYSDSNANTLGDLEVESPNEYILMQSTDLFDKNGKEIHIGDIVKYKTFYYGEEKEHTVEVIKLWNGCIATKNGNSFCPDWNEKEWNNFEVIGNIYENKELLK